MMQGRRLFEGSPSSFKFCAMDHQDLYIYMKKKTTPTIFYVSFQTATLCHVLIVVQNFNE